ncbi:MAG: SCO family protein [Chloroflexi bacterium]|nr:SCO family protein [Chloroflexota bacterium]
MKSKRVTLIAVIVVGLVLLGATAFIGGRLLTPYAFHGAVLQSPLPAQNFTMMSHLGQRMSLEDFRGKFVLLYFGYTICPDVCPTTLAELANARKLLGKEGDQMQVVMVTVDPARDTQAVLANYMTHFHPSFIGLTGTEDQIAQIATYYGIYYEKQESDSALGYLMNHTATTMVVDRNGYLRLVFPYGTSAQDMASDLQYLMSR